ncbi:MAG: hypothetical protein AAGG75_05155 [Bacteroidota bacterium]
MKISVESLEHLLEEVIKKANTNRERINLIELSEKINTVLPRDYKPLGNRYIYETIDRTIKKAKKEKKSSVRIGDASLHSLAYYIGFRDVEEFLSNRYPRLRTEAFAIEGNWYSIVRYISDLPVLLVSPVQVIIDGDVVRMKLYGKHRIYEGEINWIAGSISCFLSTTDKVKSLHLAFKLGVIKKPKLLKGVFSGVSSSGNPIAGREILWRPDEDIEFEAMSNFKVDTEESLKIDDPRIPKPIITYFSNSKDSYLKISEAGTFDVYGL